MQQAGEKTERPRESDSSPFGGKSAELLTANQKALSPSSPTGLTTIRQRWSAAVATRSVQCCLIKAVARGKLRLTEEEDARNGISKSP